MVRTHHEQRGIVDSVCEALSQSEKPFEVRKTSSGQSTFVKPWDRRFKQHSLRDHLRCASGLAPGQLQQRNPLYSTKITPSKISPIHSTVTKLYGKACIISLSVQRGQAGPADMRSLGKPSCKQTLASRRKATLSGHSSADTDGRHHPARRVIAKQCCTRHKSLECSQV